MKNIIFLFLLLIFNVNFAFADFENSLKVALNHFEQSEYDQAAEVYQELLIQNNTTWSLEEKMEVHFKLQECYQKTKEEDKRIFQLETIINSADPEIQSDMIRRCYHILMNEILILKDLKSALVVAEQGELFEKEYGSNDNYGQMLQFSGGIYYYLQDFEKVIEKYQASYDILEDDKLKFESILYLASAKGRSEYETSDSLYIEAITLAETLEDSVAMSSSYGIYGDFLFSKGRPKSAIEYLLKSVEFKPRSQMYDLGRMDGYTTIAQIFFGIKNVYRAEEYIRKATNVAEKNDFNSKNGSLAFIHGQLLVEQGKFSEGYDLIVKSANHFKEINASLAYLNAISELGVFELAKNDLGAATQRMIECKAYIQKEDISEWNAGFNRFKKFKALYLLKKNQPVQAVQIAKKNLENCQSSNSAACILSMYNILKKAYKKMGNDREAFFYSEHFASFRDSIFQSNQNEIVIDMESRYKRNEQDQKLALLDVEQKLSVEQLSRQKSIITIGGMALLFISLLSFFLFSLYKRINAQKGIIQKALSEKDTLLREIHHRVKNNLQLVSSLLTLQSRSIKDKSAIAAINDGKARVRSMALIHQDLYNKENLTGISVKDYIEKLAKEIFDTYNVENDKVQLNLNIDDIEMDVDMVVPLGLIVNELISNSLKYAFPDDRKGTLEISLLQTVGNVQLKVRDSGVGFDVEKFNSSISFGNRLVNILSDQLEGTLNIDQSNGTSIVLDIPFVVKAA